MRDKMLQQDVIDELSWDPSVDAAHIGVSVENGVVTLTGHVPSYAQKLAAEHAAKRVKGVHAIAQEIEIRYPGAHSDEDIAGRAVAALDWDVLIPKGSVQVTVSKGWVTLNGDLDWEYQRRAAATDVSKLAGVMGVSNLTTLKPRVTPTDITQRIEKALQRDAGLEARNIRVSVVDGKVKLDGRVHSWHEREAVERAAWAAPGVSAVEDHVIVGW
jgi:osmotically-inducible protein OsmY